MRAAMRCLKVLLAGAVLFGALPVRGEFLGISPQFIELSARPGSVVRGKFKVSNTEAKAVGLQIEVQNAERSREGDPPPPKTVDWLTLKASPKLVIQPLRTRSIAYRINVPSDLSGEKIALVFFSPRSTDEAGIGLQMRVGVPIYLSASGTEKAELSTGPSSVTRREDRGLQFSIVLQLEGNAHIRPRGDLLITDGTGSEIERVSLDYGNPVFPGEKKTFSAKSDRSWLPGAYPVQLAVSYGDAWGEPLKMTKDFLLTIDEDAARLEEAGRVP